jgi:hypothetical protein
VKNVFLITLPGYSNYYPPGIGGYDMIGTENGYFDEMLRRGLVSTSSSWIKKAIEQRHPRLSIAIADSRILTFDNLDRKIVTLKNSN